MLNRDDTPALPPGLELAWAQAPPTRRGPKPAHSLKSILEAAMVLADADGFTAASLPNIANQVGFSSTNALYRYVTSKEELTVLLTDAGWGPPPAEPAGGTDWRGSIRAWAAAAMERYRARPWLLDVASSATPVTPNLLGWRERLLAAMPGTGLSEVDRGRCAILVEGFVRNAAGALRAAHVDARTPAQTEALRSYLLPLLLERGYPRVAGMLEHDPADAADSVEFGLDRLLDGIGAMQAPRPD